MPVFLVRWKDEHLTDPMPLLQRRQSKHVLREHSDYVFPGLALQLLEDDVVDPGVDGLIDKGNAVDVEEEQYLQPFFEGLERFIVSAIFHYLELVIASLVRMNDFSNRSYVRFLLFLLLQKGLVFVEVFSPSSEGYPVISLVGF